MAKTKAHTRYKNSQGEIIPGVTTIIENLGWNKQALIQWARKEALSGNDPNKVRDKAGDIGSIAHYLIECHLKNEKPDLSEYAPVDVDKAENSFIAYLDWEKGKEIKLIASECQVVSELYQYGGTIDKVAIVDGIMSLVDFKSSSGLYPEHKIQVRAYGEAWNETHDQKIQSYHLLQLGKEDGSLHHHLFTPDALNSAWEIFKALRQIHTLRREI